MKDADDLNVTNPLSKTPGSDGYLMKMLFFPCYHLIDRSERLGSG